MQFSFQLSDHRNLSCLGSAIHGSVVENSALIDEFLNFLFCLGISANFGVFLIDKGEEEDSVLGFDGSEQVVHFGHH